MGKGVMGKGVTGNGKFRANSGLRAATDSPETIDPSIIEADFDADDKKLFRKLDKLLRGGDGVTRQAQLTKLWNLQTKSVAEEDVSVWAPAFLRNAAAELLLWAMGVQPRVSTKRSKYFRSGKYDHVLNVLVIPTGMSIDDLQFMCDVVIHNRNVSVHSGGRKELKHKVEVSLKLLKRYPNLEYSCNCRDEATILNNHSLLLAQGEGEPAAAPAAKAAKAATSEAVAPRPDPGTVKHAAQVLSKRSAQGEGEGEPAAAPAAKAAKAATSEAVAPRPEL